MTSESTICIYSAFFFSNLYTKQKDLKILALPLLQRPKRVVKIVAKGAGNIYIVGPHPEENVICEGLLNKCRFLLCDIDI